MRRAVIWVSAVLALSVATPGCGGGSSGGGGAPSGAPAVNGGQVSPRASEPWPSDLTSTLTEVRLDLTGDWITGVGTDPDLVIPYAPTDVVRSAYGVDDDFFYLRLEFAGTIPSVPQDIPGNPPDFVSQTATGQVSSFVINTDGNDTSGGQANPWANGVEIFFAFVIEYGLRIDIYANYDFANDDLHQHRQQVLGELGAGGPGTNFMLMRWDVSQLPPAFFPRGQTVTVGQWTEGETNLIHEMAIDTAIEHGTWTIPN